MVAFAPLLAYSADPAGEQLAQYVSELGRNPNDAALREKIIRHAQTMAPAPAVPEEAKRAMVRGKIAFEEAKTDADFKKAVLELQKAADAAPWLGAPYYNLGLAQERAGDLAGAIGSFRLYLSAAPQAGDAEAVKNRVYGLEYRLEQRQKGADRDHEFEETMSQINALDGGSSCKFLYSGCTIKLACGINDWVFSLSDIDKATLSDTRFGKYAMVVLSTRGFAKSITDTTHGASDDLCRTQKICNGVEHKDSVGLFCEPYEEGPKMKKLFERAIEMCNGSKQ